MVIINTVPSFETRQRLASHVSEPDTLKSWYDFGPDSVREQIVGNVHTPADVLEKASYSSSLAMRISVAGNPNTPQEVLRRLATDESTNEAFKVVFAAVRNPIVSADILREVAETTKSVYVRETAVNHRNMPAEVLRSLSKSPEVRIRKAVAYNTNTPPDVLENLLLDENFVVSRKVIYNPSLPFKVLINHSPRLSNKDFHFAGIRHAMNEMSDTEFREKVDPILEEKNFPTGMPRNWVLKMVETGML